jgi:hypothetical protein
MQQAGTCVVIAGEKDLQRGSTIERVVADGVLEECEVAQRTGRAIIPVGATGGAAAEIWRQMDPVFDVNWSAALRRDFDQLNDRTLHADMLVASVGQLLDYLDNARQRKKSKAKKR